MPDSVPKAAASPSLDHASASAGAQALARRTLVAAGLFSLAAAIALCFDVLESPERLIAAGMTLTSELVLCAITAVWAALAPRWVRGVLCLSGPLLPFSIGLYHGLVGAPLASSTIALSLYLAGTLLLRAGPLVQATMILGAAAGYACVASAPTVAAVPAAYSAAVFGAVAALSMIASWWRDRHQPGAFSPAQTYERLRAEHTRATALLAATTALGTTVRDFNALAAIAADQICQLLDADWSVLWYRNGESVFRVAAVSGLPPAIAATVTPHALAPENFAALYDRLISEPALILPERDARRLLPLDTVAPVLKQAVVGVARQQESVVAILLAGYATRGRAVAPDSGPLLAGFAEQVGIAIANARIVEDARNANRAKSEFLATMSHELRTPINVMMGYADLMIEGAFGETTQDQLDVLNRMRHQSAQLLDLVQPMLDLNRLEARQISVAREAFRIADLIHALQLTIPTSWCKPGVSVTWGAPIGPEVVMHSDRPKIEMIVRNLVHNALKYTDRGEVAVLIDSAKTPGHAQIIVRDTGTGIAAGDLPTLFEMFGQSNSDLPRGGGVGLGLYIVKRLTDVLGGRVTVESMRGGGSTFTVTLPLEAPAATA